MSSNRVYLKTGSAGLYFTYRKTAQAEPDSY